MRHDYQISKQAVEKGMLARFVRNSFKLIMQLTTNQPIEWMYLMFER